MHIQYHNYSNHSKYQINPSKSRDNIKPTPNISKLIPPVRYLHQPNGPHQFCFKPENCAPLLAAASTTKSGEYCAAGDQENCSGPSTPRLQQSVQKNWIQTSLLRSGVSDRTILLCSAVSDRAILLQSAVSDWTILLRSAVSDRAILLWSGVSDRTILLCFAVSERTILLRTAVSDQTILLRSAVWI